MATEKSLARLAAKIEKWAKAGFNYDAIACARKTLEVDKNESKARAPKKSGALAGTIRVATPSSTRAAKRGIVRLDLTAGSSSLSNPVIYASVHQRGLVGWPGVERTAAHVIGAQRAEWVGRKLMRGRKSYSRGSNKTLSFSVGGQRLAREAVHHPGSRFKARNYLQVNESRAAQTIERGAVEGFEKATR